VGAVSSNQWHNVVAVVNRAGTNAQIFVDGSMVASTASLSYVRNDFATNEDIYLGQFKGSVFPFNGLIDEARIHSSLESSNWVWASWMTVVQNSSFEAYSNIVSSAPPEQVEINARFSAGNLTLSGSGGNSGATFYVVGSTNLAVPVALWPIVVTTNFDGYGNFSVNVPISPTTPALYLRIKE
jgi:hypothetical protein